MNIAEPEAFSIKCILENNAEAFHSHMEMKSPFLASLRRNDSLVTFSL